MDNGIKFFSAAGGQAARTKVGASRSSGAMAMPLTCVPSAELGKAAAH